jgi:hypothetical protein
MRESEGVGEEGGGGRYMHADDGDAPSATRGDGISWTPPPAVLSVRRLTQLRLSPLELRRPTRLFLKISLASCDTW